MPSHTDVVHRNCGVPPIGWFMARVLEVVAIINVVEPGAVPGITDDGLNLQDAPVGRPEQVKPPIGVE